MDILFFDRRPMLLFCLSIIIGVYTATGENTIMPVVLGVFLLAGAALRRTKPKYIITALVLAAVFFSYGLLVEENFDSAYSQFGSKVCNVSATVVEVSAEKEKYTLATVRPNGFLKKKIKVYIMGNRYNLIQGDRITFRGTLEKPVSATNPGGYDARKVYYSDGIAAYVFTESEDMDLIEGFTLGHVFGLIRKDIYDTCIYLLGEEKGSILTAMLIGDRTGLDQEVDSSFRDSGLSHTMAVSGAHVAYILVPLMVLCRKLGMERRRYYPWLLAVLLAFALLTGFSPSVARASLTAGLMLIAGLLSRETDALNSLSMSAVILVIINPFAIYDAGFILSYVCVAAILVFYKPISELTGKSPVMKVTALTLAVQLGVLPVTAKIFYSIQIFSVLSNLLIFPVRALLALSGWIMYLASNILMPLSKLIAPMVGELVKSISQVADLFGSSGLSSINVPYIPAWLVALYFVAVYMTLSLKKYRMIPAAAGILVFTVYLIFLAVPVDTFVFFDTGQADSFLVKTDKGRDIVIDTGKFAQCNPLAYFCGDYIDFIFLTHAHSDHTGGLEAILARFRVGMVFIPGCRGSQMNVIKELCNEYKVPCKCLSAGIHINADGYEIEVLNPFNKDYSSLNDTSVVLKLTHGDMSLLFTGDIEMPAEIDILSSGQNLNADIFKIPHHGASGSAYNGFYKAVDADIAVISCGENYYGHPSYEALKLLSDQAVYRTDRDGAIIIKSIKDGYRITLCRHQITEDLKLN